MTETNNKRSLEATDRRDIRTAVGLATIGASLAHKFFVHKTFSHDKPQQRGRQRRQRRHQHYHHRCRGRCHHHRRRSSPQRRMDREESHDTRVKENELPIQPALKKPKTVKTAGSAETNDKSAVTEWRLFQVPSRFTEGQPVLLRSKSARERGKRGRVIRHGVGGGKAIEIVLDCAQPQPTTQPALIKKVAKNRLFPIYAVPPQEQQQQQQQQCQRRRRQQRLVLITDETHPYRNMASSQILPDKERVLEIGCSTGQTSRILVRYAASWLGLDTSAEMIDRCRQDLPDQHAVQMDPLTDPSGTERTVRNVLGPNGPTAVFIDIGGNRELEGVVRMTQWCQRRFEPRLVVIKSRALVRAVRDATKQDDTTTTTNNNETVTTTTTTTTIPDDAAAPAHTSSCTVQWKDDGRIVGGQDWFVSLMNTMNSSENMPSHPKKAPLRLSPVDPNKPICRYHNYDPNGCRRHREGTCDLDHVHCHRCLQPGHRALECDRDPDGNVQPPA